MTPFSAEAERISRDLARELGQLAEHVAPRTVRVPSRKPPGSSTTSCSASTARFSATARPRLTGSNAGIQNSSERKLK